MSIFIKLTGLTRLPCNPCDSMKQAIQSLRDSRMTACSLSVIIWMSGQAVMDQKKWHTISMLAYLQTMLWDYGPQDRTPHYQQSSTLQFSVLCLWPSMMPPGSAQIFGLHRATYFTKTIGGLQAQSAIAKTTATPDTTPHWHALVAIPMSHFLRWNTKKTGRRISMCSLSSENRATQ